METKVDYIYDVKELMTDDGGIDLSHLARLMLRWETQHRLLDELAQAIKDAVLQLGKTQNVGYVRATYNQPRKSYDYETPCQEAMIDGDLLREHSKYVTDWRALCKAAKIEPIVTPGEGPGSVTLTLLK
jgi:hypothetical protein